MLGNGTQARAWADAAGSLDIDPFPRVRPTLLRWLSYAFWAPLPTHNRTWVLYDATCSTWVLRHVGRLLTIAVLPITAVVVLLPGPLSVRVLTAVVAGLGGFLFAGVWVNEATDYRLIRAGWPVGTGSELRQRRASIAEWMASVQRL
jgi:hypothetical protein